MPRKNYESPSTRYQMVEVESAFCGASSNVTNPDNANGRIVEHSINNDFGGDFSESVPGSGWDIDPTK